MYLCTFEFCAGGVLASDGALERETNLLRVKDGVPFVIWGDKPATPAPTLIMFASPAAAKSLDCEQFPKCGKLLATRGVLCVSVELPGHGGLGPNDGGALEGWRAYANAGRDFVTEYYTKAKEVLDYLIAEKYTDLKRVAVCGISRGGFIALHFAAAEPRVRCAAAFAPVTDLAALAEFQGVERHPLIQSLSLANQAENLAGRPVWIAIGGQDERVGTGRAVAFGKAVTAAATRNKHKSRLRLEVHQDTVGHTTPKGSFEAAGLWIESQLH
jgi:dienelactone hydrolase